VMLPPEGFKTAQGYELQQGVNNLGSFLLTYFLRPILVATAKHAPKNSVRVIWVSSGAVMLELKTAIDFTNMNYKREESAMTKYRRSKAGNAVHAAELARRVADEGILSLVRPAERGNYGSRQLIQTN
jgi:NAD(P)-dependent dehydrogenase (short-subunit alcohol dehydrogenase family)